MLFLYNRRGAGKAATRVVGLLSWSLAKPFLSDARQPEVGFLHPWAVVLPNFSANLLYKRKDT